jgi:O-antigen/teichoic acid export membrane protein
LSFARSLALRATSEAISKLGGIVLLLVSARVLGVERFGVFALAWATGWLLSLVADMGLHMLTARRAASESDHSSALAGATLAAKALWSGAAGLLLLVAAWGLFDGEHAYVVLAVGFGLLSLSFVDLVQHLYRGRGRFDRDAALQVGARLALLALGLVGLLADDLRGLSTGILIAGGASALASGALFVADCGRPTLAPQPARSLRATLAEALPIGLGALVSVLAFRIDVYIIEALRDEASVGLYSSAYKLFEASQAFPAVLMTVVFPRLAAGTGVASETLRRRSIVVLVLAGLAVATVGGGLAPAWIDVLYGRAFAEAATPLAVLCLAAPIMFVNYFLTQDLIARGRARAFLGGAALALLVNVVSNLALIPRYGTTGAAVATIASELALSVACLAALWSRS